MAVEQGIVVVCGYPGAGKSTITKEFVDKGYIRLNRDEIGGRVDGLTLIKLKEILDDTDNIVPGVIMDNTYATPVMRHGVLDWAQRKQVPVHCVWLDTSIEDAQVNVVQRMIERYGKIVSNEEMVKLKDPNMFPPAVLFSYRKNFEPPTIQEGFSSVERRKFVRRPQSSEYKNKGLLLDYDGCLRTTKSGAKYPTTPDDIDILPGRKEVLELFRVAGFFLCGISNQSGVAKGDLTFSQVMVSFKRTNDMLGQSVDVSFCPHRIPPISCYCRKPMPALAVSHIEKWKLDKKKTILVGDMTTDKTCAHRTGINFMNSDEFFAGGYKKWLTSFSQT